MKFDLNINLDRNKYDTYSERLKELRKCVELKNIDGKRSPKINKYLHVCIDLYAIEFGNTRNEAKTDLKRYCPFMTYEKNGKKYLVETSKQTNEECSTFVSWIRNYASKQGLYIADAEEYRENRFSIDREIDRHKEYL